MAGRGLAPSQGHASLDVGRSKSARSDQSFFLHPTGALAPRTLGISQLFLYVWLLLGYSPDVLVCLARVCWT